MSNFKVVRDAQNTVVCFGPNTTGYAPGVPAGCTLSIEESCPSMPAPLDVHGFKAWLTDNMSVSLKKKVHGQYPGLVPALNQPDWPLVEDYLTDAKTNATLALTSGQWNALRAAALTTYRLPVALPAAI